MSRYENRALGEFLRFYNGKSIKPGGQGDVPVYGSNGRIGMCPSGLYKNGIVVGRVGAYCGSVEYCPGPFWASDNTIVVIPDSGICNVIFAGYLLRYMKLNRWAGGSAQPLLTQTVLRQLEAPLPSLMIQDRIASILSAYDDLIENNTKRIKILEEMARLAFDHTWSSTRKSAVTRKLGDICDEVGGTIRTGPFGSQLHESDYAETGTPVVMPKSIIGGRIDTSDIARIPDEIVERLSQHVLKVGDIVYGRRGDIGRRAYVHKRQDGWFCGTGCLRISIGGKVLHPRYLYEYLGKPEIISSIAARAVGATMPNLNTSILRDVSVDVPSYDHQKKFVEIAEDNDGLIENLTCKNENLRSTRDLLLPKLISGEIDVSHIPLPDEAA